MEPIAFGSRMWEVVMLDAAMLRLPLIAPVVVDPELQRELSAEFIAEWKRNLRKQ